MKREIKFRAWDFINNRMEYGVNVNDGKPVKKGYQWFLDGNTVHNSNLEQFTGLTDKNGKEIYEGDIVKGHYDAVHNDKKINIKGVVMFNDASFCISDDLFTHYRWIDYELEVIGNIHETPNLLK